MVIRFLLSLAFDNCEEEGDAEGLRSLRRVMVTINPSGTAGGGLFRDKYEEHCVRCLRSTHRSSVLRGRLGKEHSKDMIGEEVRDQLEEYAAMEVGKEIGLRWKRLSSEEKLKFELKYSENKIQYQEEKSRYDKNTQESRGLSISPCQDKEEEEFICPKAPP